MSDIQAMGDADITVVHAFMVALYMQKEPLSANVQQKLQEIGQSLDKHVNDLINIALSDPNLKEPFNNACSLLTNAAAEQGLGIGDISVRPPDVGEIANVSRAIQDTKIFFQKDNLQKVPEIISSADPAKNIQEEIQ